MALIERFYAALLAVMKEAKRLSFDQRYGRLAPAIGQTFDLGLMTRIAVGPGWAQLPADQQQRITDAFTRYTISNYANRFDDYGGERFEVSPTTDRQCQRRHRQHDAGQKRTARRSPSITWCARRARGGRSSTST